MAPTTSLAVSFLAKLEVHFCCYPIHGSTTKPLIDALHGFGALLECIQTHHHFLCIVRVNFASVSLKNILTKNSLLVVSLVFTKRMLLCY